MGCPCQCPIEDILYNAHPYTLNGQFDGHLHVHSITTNRSILFVLISLASIVSSWERQGKFSGQHLDAQEKVEAQSESAPLGCIWDGSGCASGCDTESMMTRCQRLNHDQEACEGEEGQMIR